MKKLKRYVPKIYLGSELLYNFNRAIRFEWIVTNGLGGYASSTVLNINTRKFHGLLFVAFNPPVSRHLLLSKIDEEIQVGNDRFPLNSNEFRDKVYPEGYKNLKSFALQPFPTFHYQIHEVYMRKEVFMPHLKSMVIIIYEVFNVLNDDISMNLYPLVNMRHFYETTDKNDLQFSQSQIPNGVMLESHPNTGYLAIFSTIGKYIPNRNIWIERIYFRTDDSRGEDCLDDNYQPGFFQINLPPKKISRFHVVAIGGKRKEEVNLLFSAASERRFLKNLYLEEINRREKLLKRFYEEKAEVKQEDWLDWLILSADSFIVNRKTTGKKSIIAGYHWFEDWGRDSLIALPGLTLITGRFRDAEEIILNFKQYCRSGLMPNRFPDKSGDEPVYDSVDATLWFFNAVLQYLKYTGNFDFVRKELWDTLQEIVERHIHGTMFNIHMDDDGLLLHGSRLTWMDASIDGKPVTPREGKAVEVQALWYNALKFMEVLSSKFGDDDQSQKYHLIAEKAKKSFNEKFWHSEEDYLFDVVSKDGSDQSLRPNQIIAACLDFSILDPKRREDVVNAVWEKLRGIYGLRSLSPDDPKYIGRYAGGFIDRDRAYHNGTVWAWLLGPFVTAFLKAKNYEAYWRRFAFENFLQPTFYEETRRAGLGTISEIFDGNPPHSPKGCVSQAWSVAEPLRAYIEDVLLIRPKWERRIFNLVNT